MRPKYFSGEEANIEPLNQNNTMTINEIELKALAFDYIASHGNGSEMSVEGEDTIFDFVNTIIKHFKGE